VWGSVHWFGASATALVISIPAIIFSGITAMMTKNLGDEFHEFRAKQNTFNENIERSVDMHKDMLEDLTERIYRLRNSKPTDPPDNDWDNEWYGTLSKTDSPKQDEK
jgi:hypothetical protein